MATRGLRERSVGWVWVAVGFSLLCSDRRLAAQAMQELAITEDGSVVYFASPVRQQDSGQSAHWKIFQWDEAGGLRVAAVTTLPAAVTSRFHIVTDLDGGEPSIVWGALDASRQRLTDDGVVVTPEAFAVVLTDRMGQSRGKRSSTRAETLWSTS